jgi:hypothetical protein
MNIGPTELIILFLFVIALFIGLPVALIIWAIRR